MSLPPDYRGLGSKRTKAVRKLTDHIVSQDQASQLNVTVVDEPGDGGANHCYQIDWVEGESRVGCDINFQNGPISESGVNGITNEALAAIIIDRLRGFQSGKFSCRDNALALTNFEQGLMWLQNRTRSRLARGVEGTHQL